MLRYILILILIVIIFYMIKNHVKVKFKTFFQRGFYKTSKPYGVYCYCGKQGKGKTYSVIEFLLNNAHKEIYCNIKSIQGINYTYINGIEELLSLRDKKNCIIVFDEIFTILQKGSKMNEDILDFLSQMRKREMIFITTAQEWLEINMTLRRYCRYQIECNMISFIGYPILIKKMYDAEQMKWSQEENEYIAPVVTTTISHGLKKVISSYDTYEQIGKYSNTNENLKIGYKNLELEDVKENNLNEIEKSSVFSALPEQKNTTKIVKLPAFSFTTTIKKMLVNGQFTNKFTKLFKKRNKKLKEKNNVLTSVDNDFWENINSNDIDESVK